MAEARAQRKLAAILAADVVGYSRLMEADEDGTLRRLKALRRGAIDPAIADHDGRLVKLTGDGALVEFASVVDAVRCAGEIQRRVADDQRAEPPGLRIAFRIGINLGDVIVDGDDVYGDGVNIAARLEALAEPGGILISGSAHEQVSRQVPFRFEDIGDQQFKNIARPVRAWRVHAKDAGATSGEAATPASVRTDRPGIAVLPFANMSGDPEQDYFADGMVEELITGLASLRWLTVIARNSTFAYKGTSPDIRKVGRELAVRYVLEGSVRKAGTRVRITAQLIEAETGGHIWADRFDGGLADVFDLQDQITARVVAAIEPSVRRAEIARAKRQRPGDLDSWDLYLRALEKAYTFTPDGRDQALAMLDKAIAIVPGYPEAHGLAAWCRQQRYLWGGRAAADKAAALHHAEVVAAADCDDATALSLAAFALGALGRNFETAFLMLSRALAHNPSSAIANDIGAVLNLIVARFEAAIAHAERALVLSPFDPLRFLPEGAIMAARLATGDNEAALAAGRRALEANPAFAPAVSMVAVCLVRLGRLDEARAGVARLLEISPETHTETFAERMLFSDALGKERLIADLRTAGLPG